MKEVIVIGAGIGGLTTGIRLLQNGYRVTILEKESTVYELDNTYKTPYEVLNLLDTMPYNDESILYSLTMIDDINTELESNLLNITEHIISDNTRYEYILRDITTDKLLLKTSDNKKIIYSGRKIVNGHVFELDFLI